MLNCFCGMVDQRKAFSLISSRISDTPRAGFEPAQNLSSGSVEWRCARVTTTTLRRQKNNSIQKELDQGSGFLMSLRWFFSLRMKLVFGFPKYCFLYKVDSICIIRRNNIKTWWSFLLFGLSHLFRKKSKLESHKKACENKNSCSVEKCLLKTLRY